MSLIVVGTNHKHSSITLREQLYLSKNRIRDVLGLIRERGILKGAVIFSTCNRIEIYGSCEDAKEGVREIKDFISRFYEIDKKNLYSYFYIYEDKLAIRHLFCVACGLDSLVLGETQILSQARSSFSESERVDFTDELLRKIFLSATSFAKTIHQETKISQGKVSVGSVAIDFIKEKLGSLRNKNILIIGVGKVTELVLKYLKKENSNVVFISNRTFEKAKDLACQIDAKAVRFDDLKQFLNKADVVITATASPHAIINKETLKGINSSRLLIVDLALPRDVDPRVKELSGIDLFCLEDLDTIIKKNTQRRIKKSKEIKGIIDIEVEKLWKEFIGLEQDLVLLPLGK